VVTHLYELFWDGRVEEAVELLDPDIEWREPPESPDQHIVYGREAALAALNTWLANWADYEVEVNDVIKGGDGRILVCMRQRARGPATGIEVESDLFHVWTMRDDVPVRAEMYLTRETAYEAARIAP
jgi:ketosteroid isomerase-like protein